MHRKLPKILVTGGAGFIGSEFVRQAIAHGYAPLIVDKLTYAGDLGRLKGVHGRYKFYKTDICAEGALEAVFKKEKPQIVIHFAAETHVDRSIQQALPFIETNIKGTQALIDLSKKYRIKRFIHISTDEVYGDIKKGQFSEKAPLKPNSPYAASKAAADLLVKASIRTFGFPAIIVRPSNNYGPWQYPEKLIPVIIFKALKNQGVPVYSRGENMREWLYVSDCARAILMVLKKGKLGEVYNIGSGYEKKNIEVVKKILLLLNKPQLLIRYIQDRPGHDFRYALDFSRIRSLGWEPQVDFQEGVHRTVHWYRQNFSWLENKSKCLTAYWNKVYRK